MAGDSVATISYHGSDQFNNAVSNARASYYGVSGTPTVKLDGNHEVAGGTTYGTMYASYRRYFDQRKVVASPLDFELITVYDTTSRMGTLAITIRNTTANAVSGQLQVALCESHYYLQWTGGMDSVHHIARAMLPTSSGEAVTVPANDSLVVTRDFTIDAAWVAPNCEFVVFVQNNSTREIYQGARTGVLQEPLMNYAGYQTAFPRPGQSTDLFVGVRNSGFGNALGVTGTLSTADTFVSVTQPNAGFPDVGHGRDAYSSVPFTIQVDASCPDQYVAMLDLALEDADGPLGTVSFPVNVATHTGFSDSMEAGVGGWTHSGTRDQWHQTEHRSTSPTHSWYSGTEGTWQYTAENDARLVSPYFTVGTVTAMGFKHFYATEVDFDFPVVEINNGSRFWNPLAIYNGSSGGFQDVFLPLDAYAGQTVRIGFRFLSDVSINGEGWYVDDFWGGPSMAVEEELGLETWRVTALTNPVGRAATIGYSVAPGHRAGLAVYDAGGRLVRNLASGLAGSGRLAWDLADGSGCRVQAGTYFARLTGDRTRALAKLVVTR